MARSEEQGEAEAVEEETGRETTGWTAGAGVISSAGDALAQVAIEKKTLDQLDFKRSCRFFMMSFGFNTPVYYCLLNICERIFRPGPLKLIKQVSFEMLCYLPTFYLGSLVLLRMLEGHSPVEAVQKCRQDWWHIYSRGLIVWLPTQLVNNYFVPVHRRVLFVQIVSLFWNCYFSHQTQNERVKAVAGTVATADS